MVAILESTFVGLSDASPVYFVAVVIAGSLLGTWPAIATALASFLVYDLLFTQPTFNLIVSDPRELLESMYKIENLTTKIGGRIFFSHDPESYKTYKKAPEFYGE